MQKKTTTAATEEPTEDGKYKHTYSQLTGRKQKQQQ